MLDTSSMNALEKAKLAKQLIEEVVEEATTNEFASRSDSHKRIGGLFKVFGREHFVSYARMPFSYLTDIQEKEGFV